MVPAVCILTPPHPTPKDSVALPSLRTSALSAISVSVREKGLTYLSVKDSLADCRILAQQLLSFNTLKLFFSSSSLHNWWWEVCCQSDCHFLMSKSLFSPVVFNFSLSLTFYNFTIMNVSVGFFLFILLWIYHDSSSWGLHLSFIWESSPQLFLCTLYLFHFYYLCQ